MFFGYFVGPYAENCLRVETLENKPFPAVLSDLSALLISHPKTDALSN
jgi:hypothetical protein